MKERAWLVFLLGGLALSLAAALSGSDAAVAALTQVAGWASVAIGYSIVRRSPHAVGRPWRFFALAASAFLVAGIVRTVHGIIIDVDRPLPSVADAIALSGHVALIIGGTLLGHLRSPDRDRTAFIDGAIIAVGLQTVVWSYLLWPYMTDATIDPAVRSVNGLYAVMTTLVLATIGRLAVGPGARTLSYRLLAAAVFTIFLQDVLVSLSVVSDSDVALATFLAPPIFVLFGAAALHPARLRIAEAPARLEVHLSWRRVAVLIGALLINPVLIGLQLLSGQDPHLAVSAISLALLTLLVMARFTLLARAQERAVEIQAIQRQANADLAAASSRHAMHRASLRATQRLVADDGARVALTQIAGPTLRVIDAIGVDADTAVGTSIAVAEVPGAIVDGLARTESAVVDGTTPLDLDDPSTSEVSLLVVPLTTQGDLSGAVVVTTPSPIAATLRRSIETLTSTLSLALESATLTENLLRRRSERRFRALVENSSDLILVVDQERQITFASPAGHRLLGIPEVTLVGSHPARWVHPEDWPKLAGVLDEPTRPSTEAGQELEIRIRHVDASHRWFEIRVKDLRHDPEIEGLVVTAREITDRKTTEQQLAASEARFRALVQNSTDVVAVVAEDGTFSYVSPAVTEVLDYAPDELVGTVATAMLAPEDRGAFRASYPELSRPHLPDREIAVQRMELQIPDRAGKLRTLDVTVTDMRHEAAVAGIVLNARDVTVRKALEHDLRYQALHDSLTGLANRTMFTQQAANALRSAGPHGATVGALFIDLDDFKTVNDSLGHVVGDQLLQEVADRLITNLSPENLAARLGGDEFAVLVVDGAGTPGAIAVADQIIELVAQPFRIQGREIRVTCSVGIALASHADEDGGSDAELLLRSADVAMYLAKDRGKNQAALFEDHLHASVFERLELKADLARAIDDNQLTCHYQPIVSLQTWRITGVEALVRWDHPVRGRLTPDAFIPLAEDTGLIVPLGLWVLREACQQLRSWQLRLAPGSSLTMSVNLSVHQLAHENIVRDVAEAIDAASLDPSTITLEITETTLMHDTELTRTRLAQLRDLGVSLAVDDFGTGYSSLQYVQKFPIDIIKIDRSFVAGLGTNPGDGAVVQSMIELSQRLGVHTVAEGIDRHEQITLLQSLGADLGQGYLFSRPLPADEIDALLDSSPNENPRLLTR